MTSRFDKKKKGRFKPKDMSDDRTVIAARPTGFAPQAEGQSAVPSGGGRKAWPLVLAGLLVVLLGIGSALVTIRVFSPAETAMSPEVLEAPLVVVDTPEPSEAELPETPDEMDQYVPPRLIELAGAPLIVRRAGNVSRQLVKLPQEKITAAKSLKLAGDVYRFSDTFSASEAGPAGGFQGSQQDFAFDQSQGTAVAPDGGEVEAQVLEVNSNSNDLIINADVSVAAQTEQEFAGAMGPAKTVWNFLVGLGFSEDGAKAADAALQVALNASAVAATDTLAVLGIPDEADTSKLIPAQVAVYREGRYLGSIGLTDNMAYAPSSDPWNGQPPEIEVNEAGASLLKERLLDAIYSAAIRNKLPTPVIGETLLLLSRSNDLEQPAASGDGITMLFSEAPRDLKNGFGRVLYVRISRTAGDMECYAVQSKPGKPFDCVSVDGEERSGISMISPVKGVITARFGPRLDPLTGKKTDVMNFGVDWTARLGSPVVAAFDGVVETIGHEDELGNFVRLVHPDKRKSVYGGLKNSAANLDVGSKVAAGSIIGYVGKSGTGKDPILHFQLLEKGRPVDPFGAYQSQVEKGGVIDVFVKRIIYIESANNCLAANPLSTAVGLGQFIKSTWLQTIARHRPDLQKNRSREEVLALRTDCDLAREMTTAFTRDNATILRSQGKAVTAGNLYLAHFLGAGGALQALSAGQDLNDCRGLWRRSRRGKPA